MEENNYSYFQYLREQVIDKQSEEYGQNQDFFKKLLSNNTPSTILKDINKVDSVDKIYRSFFMPFDKSDLIINGIKKENISGATLFLSIVSWNIAKYTNENMVLCLTSFFNRLSAETMNSIGYYVRVLPFVSVINDEFKLIDWLKENQQNTLEVMLHAAYPLSNALSFLNKPVSIVINYDFAQYNDRLKLGDTEIENEEIYAANLTFDIAISFRKIKNQYGAFIEFNNAKFSTDLIKSFAENINSTIEIFANNLDKKMKELNTFDQKQIQLIQHFNETEVAVPNTNIIQYFDKVVQKYPNRIAIADKHSKLTFAELDKASNQYANYFSRELSLKSGDTICIFIKRSVQLIAMVTAA
jgi:non-ribosomal peptide synthetase component F